MIVFAECFVACLVWVVCCVVLVYIFFCVFKGFVALELCIGYSCKCAQMIIFFFVQHFGLIWGVVLLFGFGMFRVRCLVFFVLSVFCLLFLFFFWRAYGHVRHF